MTLESFISKWFGKKADWDGYYGGQCVDLFRYYCNEVLEIKQPAGVWGAANFWTDFESDPVLVDNFTKVQNTSDFTPLEGDVMVWNFNAGGGFGHIAICTGENTGTQYFKSFDQNWSRVSYCEIVNHSYKNVYGVLRPKLPSTKPPMQKPSKLLDHIGVKTEEEGIAVWDKEMAFLKDAREKVDSLKGDLDGSKVRAKELEEKHQNFLDKVSNKVGSISDESRALEAIETLISNESSMVKKVSTLEKAMVDKDITHKAEIEELRRSIEKLKQRNADLIDQVEEQETHIERLDDRISDMETEKVVNSKLNKLITDIINFFKGKS